MTMIMVTATATSLGIPTKPGGRAADEGQTHGAASVPAARARRKRSVCLQGATRKSLVNAPALVSHGLSNTSAPLTR